LGCDVRKCRARRGAKDRRLGKSGKPKAEETRTCQNNDKAIPKTVVRAALNIAANTAAHSAIKPSTPVKSSANIMSKPTVKQSTKVRARIHPRGEAATLVPTANRFA
jgi:hypothetical protein